VYKEIISPTPEFVKCFLKFSYLILGKKYPPFRLPEAVDKILDYSCRNKAITLLEFLGGESCPEARSLVEVSGAYPVALALCHMVRT